LSNTGYAAPKFQRPFYAVLDAGSSRFNLPLNSDPRTWAAGSSPTLSLDATIPSNVPPGNYRLSLWLPDLASTLQSDPNYSIRFSNTGSGIWDATTGLNVVAASVAVSAAASLNPICLAATGAAPITWAITAGSLPPGLALTAATGCIAGTPTTAGTYTFTATASNSTGSNSKQYSLTIAGNGSGPVIVSFTAQPAVITPGASADLLWSVTGASAYSIDQGVGPVTGTSVSVSPTSTTTYHLTATGSGASTTAAVTVTVKTACAPGTPQSTAMPAAAPTDSDLLTAADQSHTSLSTAINDTALAIPVAGVSTFTQYNVANVDSEQIKLCSVSTNTLTACTGGRGFAGTTAGSHGQGAIVHGGAIDAVYHNQGLAELRATQTWISTSPHPGGFGGAALTGASWPNHVITLPEGYWMTDHAQALLTAALSAGATSATVADGSCYHASQLVLTGNELYQIGSVSGNTLNSLTRGLGSTTAAAHAIGSTVLGGIFIQNWNRLMTELSATEHDLFGQAGSTVVGICGIHCTATAGVSWPNHFVTPNELTIAVPGGNLTAAMWLRFTAEVKALTADLKAHP
jgi:PKD repeat protein